MTEITLGRILLILFLVFLNGFFVASEFAFVKIRISRINTMIAKGSRRARTVKKIVEDLDRSLSSTQLGITLASIALGFAGEEPLSEGFRRLFEGANHLFRIEQIFSPFGIEFTISEAVFSTLGFLTGYLLITFLHVVLGELAPKSISIQFAEKTALVCAEPLYWFMVLTNPLLSFFVWASNKFLGLVGIEPATETHTQVFSEDELKIIIRESIEDGEIEPFESKLIFKILDFTDSNVKSILTPRIDIVALPIDATPQEILQKSQSSGYSRIPIYKGNLDNIEGFVHIKDVFPFQNDFEGDFDIEDILRPVIVVPEGKPLDDLLKEMQKLKTQVATIVDEYGSVEGIVTIEDILEYIVGPIDDEFDSKSPSMVSIQGNTIVAGGLVALDTINPTINELYGVELDSDDAATLAGYILELFESEIPHAGMTISNEPLEFKIIESSGNRLEKIKISETEPKFEIEDDIIKSSGRIKILDLNSSLDQLFGVTITDIDDDMTLVNYLATLNDDDMISENTVISDDQLNYKITKIRNKRIQIVEISDEDF